jgi:Ca-activated chloride channel family protein
MISFAQQWYLLFLVLVVPLLILVMKMKSLNIEDIFSKEVRERVFVKSGTFLNYKRRLALLVLALAFMVVALARPVILDENVTKEDIEGFNLIVLIDVSKSMSVKDLFPSRLEYAKAFVSKVLQEFPEANVAVLAFSQDAFLVTPFSKDAKSIEFLVEHLNPEYLTTQGSLIVSALRATQKLKDAQDAEILLLSDGADGLIQESLDFIEEKNLRVHVLNIGTSKGDVIYNKDTELIKDKEGNIVISKRDDAVLALAKQSGGAYLSVSNVSVDTQKFLDSIKKVSKKIKMKHDKLEGAKELFIYPLIVSFVLVFFSFNAPRFFFIFLLLFTCKDVQAGLFDFYHLKKANESYKAKEYEQAAKEFSKLQNKEALYNEANALYKQKEFQKAQKIYEGLKFEDKTKEMQRLHNLGNSYVQTKEYEKAIKSYDEALKQKYDEDTKFNLELLKKQNKDKKDQNNSQKQKNKEEKKNNQKQENKSDQAASDKKEEKQMSESEAQKWEKLMQNKELKTQPLIMEKNRNSDVQNSW